MLIIHIEVKGDKIMDKFKKSQTCEPITHLPTLLNTPLHSNTSSPEPNDGTFIEDTDPTDSFTSKGTVRYGEEVDVDDF